MFHSGAAIPSDYPSLEGGGDTARYMRFFSKKDADERSEDLEAIARAWCDLHG